MIYDVLGLGNPLIDIILQVDDAFLQELHLDKGSMNLVGTDRQKEILLKSDKRVRTTTLGGSCANSMVMIAQLGGKSAFGGKVGDDDLADDYESQLIKNRVDSYLKRQPGMTGSTIILVNPDAERTMNTHLGMSQNFSKTDLDKVAIQNSKYIYVEGYLWDTEIQKETVMTALNIAKESGTNIALTLSDSYCVERHHSDFQKLIEQYVDILFCNEYEAGIMTGAKECDDQLKTLSSSVDHIVLTMGKSGSKIFYQNEVINIPVFETVAVDTTGAGDSFAAGYLYGITHQYTVKDAGMLASYCASTIVGQTGPRYQGDFRSLVKDYIID